jgi:WD40 repeat protein
VAVGARDGTLSIRDTLTGAPLHELCPHADGLLELAASPDGTLLATWLHIEHGLRLWEPATGELRLDLTTSGRIRDVAFSGDGSWFASAEDDAIHIRETTTGEIRRSIPDYDPCSLAIAPDGTWLASRSFDTMTLWDAATGSPLWRVKGDRGDLFCGAYDVAIAPDGSWLAYVNCEEVVVCDARSGRDMATLVGHTGAVWGMAVSPDGNRIVTIGQDHEVRLWEPSGRLLATTRLDADLESCAIDDHGHVVVGSGRGVFLFTSR